MSDIATLDAPETEAPNSAIDIDRTRGNFSYPESHEFDAGTGLTHETIDYIVDVKGEPDWIRQFRHKALDTFLAKPMPTRASAAETTRPWRAKTVRKATTGARQPGSIIVPAQSRTTAGTNVERFFMIGGLVLLLLRTRRSRPKPD